MLTKFTILISFIFFLLTSCNIESKKNVNSFQIYVTDTSLTHRQYNEVDFSRRMSSLLNLSTIDKGVDSFELRIWVTSMMIPKQLTILKFGQNKWVSYEYRYYPNDYLIDSMTVYNMPIPKEIDEIVVHLKQKEILDLPSQIAIPNFEDRIADGQTCSIEISTNKFYKALQYHCPEHFSDELNNIKFMELINFLNRYFKFYIPWCKPSE